MPYNKIDLSTITPRTDLDSQNNPVNDPEHIGTYVCIDDLVGRFCYNHPMHGSTMTDYTDMDFWWCEEFKFVRFGGMRVRDMPADELPSEDVCWDWVYNYFWYDCQKAYDTKINAKLCATIPSYSDGLGLYILEDSTNGKNHFKS